MRTALLTLVLLTAPPLAAGEITAITFSGTKGDLNPPFRADVPRYSVILSGAGGGDSGAPGERPAAGGNGEGARSPRVTVDTRDGSAVFIDAAAPGTRLRISTRREVSPGEEGDGPAGTTPSHEIVLLPPDFPALRTSVSTSAASEYPLYVTLVDPPVHFVAQLDGNGVPLFYRRDEREVFDFRHHPLTGERSYARRTGALNEWGRDQTERVVLDGNFEEVTRLSTTGLTQTGHHEFLVFTDDLVLMMAYDGRRADLREHGQAVDAVVEDSVLQLLSREDGGVLFEWNTRDHVDFDEQTYPTVNNEYAHMNAVSLDDDGDYLVSLRGLSQVMKVSSESGEVRWRLGGKRGDFRFVDDPLGGFCGQHLPVRLDNGNTLIGWGFGPDVVASEVTPEGETVFELVAESTDDTPVHSYRVYRFPD